ncbi:acyl-CoA thioesterase [Brevibacterium sp. 50QC2O2]|jgi:acyl-CoA thioester hydrolase|uniref:acyl-CoA thioesterase n=1 Tax=Brevibacterium TaxID=1696 RepID=UPI00211D0D81|nr:MULTISPECIES: acyl-CoA thioesterase [unclassified Brevibacterium]MCQ9368322.1 acyl-CoA thioesterase [Brevibacterium sp. 91QC2O2]MCQ9384821.1 acyl-CoA thioesterase [Brevibacterium sp. 68QC2CO]MCQ9387586.1 acyl-CoA thioesterase [Brevibacterium sp. 50QC2O2]
MSFELVNPLISGPFTRVLIELRWGDMDAYGHVNNVTQLKILEEARVRAFGSPTAARDVQPVAGPAGAARQVFGTALPQVFRAASDGADILVSSHAIEYRTPVPYREGPIAVDLVLAKVSPVLITVGYVIGEPDGSAQYSVAETDVVFVDSITHRARRLSEHEYAELSGAVVGPIRMKRRK